MSKGNSAYPGHYKVAGRGRQGDGLLQQEQKQAFVAQRESVRLAEIQEHAGAPAWEATPPNLETASEPVAAAPKPRKKTLTKTPKKTAKKAAKKTNKKASTRRSTVRKPARPRRRTR